MIAFFFNNFTNIFLLTSIFLLWCFLLSLFFLFIWSSTNKSDKLTLNKNVLINKIFASNVKFYFLRHKFTRVVFEPKPFFLEQKTISMDLFFTFLEPEEIHNFIQLLDNYKNQKKNTKKTFTVKLQIKKNNQKYYFKNIGFFSKTLNTGKVYNSNYISFSMSNLDKLLR